MSTLSFFKQVGISKLGNIGDSMVAWYAQHDPETASAADIAELGKRAEGLAHRIAEKQSELVQDQRLVTELTEKLDRDKRAAGVIGTRLKTALDANDATLVTQITGQLDPVMTEIEQLAGEDGTGETSGQLFDAQTEWKNDTDDLARFREAHTRAISDWTTARSRLDRARSQMEHAEQQRRDATERAAQAERDAGLLRGSRPGNTALDAMEARANALRTEAQAKSIQADALRQQQGSDVSDIVKQALAEQQPDKGSSALDRLARLTNKV